MKIIQYKTNKIVLEPFHVLQILVYLLELQPKSHHIASDTFHIHLMTVQIVSQLIANIIYSAKKKNYMPRCRRLFVQTCKSIRCLLICLFTIWKRVCTPFSSPYFQESKDHAHNLVALISANPRSHVNLEKRGENITIKSHKSQLIS